MSFGLQQHIIDTVISIFDQHPKVDKAILFGSRAKGNYHPNSDIDIALKGQDLHTDDIIAMSIAFEEKEIPLKIDLINYYNIKEPVLSEHIDRVGIEFYSRWKLIPLSKTTKFIVDNRGKTVPTSNSGIPLIATNCIDNDNLYPVYKNVRYISQHTYDTWFRSHPEPGDIILTLKGSQNGAVCIVPDPIDFAIAQDMVALRANEKIIDSNFLFAALRSSEVQYEIKNLDVSGVIPHLKKSDFDKLILPYPDMETQKIIGDIYFTLSKKIDLLHNQNNILEQLAETMFRQRFVEEAEDYELGCLGDVISIFDNLRIPLSSMKRDKMKVGKLYPYYGAAKIMDYINVYIFDGEYILMGEDGTVQTEEGFPILQMPTDKFWVNNHTHVLQAKKPYSNYLVYIFLKRTKINHIVTGAVQPKINQENLKSLDFPILPDEKINDFVNMTNDYWEKIKSNNTQVHTLTQTRDTLLPKLMRGEVRVTCTETNN